MSRYIDAEHFSERFDMMCDAGGVLAPVTKAVREMVKELIKAEPTADVESVKGWISVKERLPEDSSDVLVVCRDKGWNSFGETYNDRIRVAWYHAPIREWRLYNIVGAFEIIYWMPLPEVPEEDAKMDGGEEDD